ncbi:MAG TPA: glycosyltransferase family 87 protein [Chthonomonadaceae bacterium]|nr:glycosyltransferase family 87 protein [Chthonomonadaceae bacterium]
MKSRELVAAIEARWPVETGLVWLRRLFLPADGEAGTARTAMLLAALAAPLLLGFLLARGAFDFDCYWVGSWAVRDGQPAAMYAALDTPNAQGYYDLANDSPAWHALAAAHLPKPHTLWGFIYPPPCAALFLPFTYLPRPLALLGWRLLNLGAYGCGLLMLLYLMRARLKPLEAQVVTFVALASPPLLIALSLGQITPLVFFTAAAGLYFLETGRPAAAGVSLAVGALLKVSPILFAVWLLTRRQYRALAALAAALIGLSLASIALLGAETFRRFLGHCLPLLARGAISDTNVSAVALAGRMLGLGDPHSGQILPPDTRLTLLKFGFYGLVLAVSAAALWRGRRESNGERRQLEYALVNMVALLVSPITWGHHLLLALLTLVIIAGWGLSEGRRGLVALAAAAYLLMLQNRDLPGSFLPTEVGAVAALAGIALLWLVTCAALFVDPRSQDAEPHMAVVRVAG